MLGFHAVNDFKRRSYLQDEMKLTGAEICRAYNIGHAIFGKQDLSNRQGVAGPAAGVE